jgi:F0F1-type ATP synthase alpha subunit
MAAFAQFGSDLDASTQRLLQPRRAPDELLKQPQFSRCRRRAGRLDLRGVNGFLDNCAANAVTRFESACSATMRSDHGQVAREDPRHQDAGRRIRRASSRRWSAISRSLLRKHEPSP